jgi:hypothetical protein
MIRSLRLVALITALSAMTGCSKETTCPVGELLCAGTCVDPASDAAHCGSCGTACDARATCQRGACDCAPGLSACGTSCVDRSSDPGHCGSCGISCLGTVCSSATGPALCSAACGAGETDCSGACLHLDRDRFHCGACGTSCAAGESCVSGTCTSLLVACFSTNDVRSISPDLASRGPTRPAGVGPIALATIGADAWAAASLSGSLVRLPLDLRAASKEYLLHGKDFEYVTTHAGRVLLSSAGAGTVVVVDPVSGAVLDEVAVGTSAGDNIKGIAFAQTNAIDAAFVSLQGDAVTGDPALGQKVAVLDAAGLASCGLTGGPAHCLTVIGSIDLSGGADAPGLAFPGRSVTVGNKVYVVLANLQLGPFGYFTDPAGPGRLAVIDPADRSVGYLPLGAACGNPGGIAIHGQSIWVACAAFGASGLVEVDLSGTSPMVGPLHAVPLGAPGNVAFCGDHGFVTDQYSGDVYPFDAMTFADSPPAAATICPVSAGPGGYAWASDVTCAIRP